MLLLKVQLAYQLMGVVMGTLPTPVPNNNSATPLQAAFTLAQATMQELQSGKTKEWVARQHVWTRWTVRLLC